MPYKDPENKRKYQLARYHRLRMGQVRCTVSMAVGALNVWPSRRPIMLKESLDRFRSQVGKA